MSRRTVRSGSKSRNFARSFFSSLFGTIHNSFTPQIRETLTTVLLLAVSFFSLLSLFGSGGILGEWLSLVLRIGFGKAAFAFPLFLLFFTGIRTVKGDDYSWMHRLGFTFFLLSFFGFWHIAYEPEGAWNSALEGMGGGVAGVIFGTTLRAVTGVWGAVLLLSALCIASLLITLNMSFRSCVMWIVEEFKKIKKQNYLREKKDTLKNTYEESITPKETLLEQVISPFRFSKKNLSFEQDQTGEAHSQEEVSPKQHKSSAPQSNDDIALLKPSKKANTIQLSLDLLQTNKSEPTSGDIKMNRMIIEKTFQNFGINVEMGEVRVGPTVTQYTLKPAEGIKLSSITGLHNDLALALAAHPIRIEAPIPGKSLVGIEVPNQKTARVYLRDILDSEEFKKRKDAVTISLGKDVAGVSRIASLAAMPHLLIAGATGSGKTVCMNGLIVSLLYQNTPADLRFIMIDPKRVELSYYNGIPHLLTPVVTDVKKTLNALRWAIKEMERRFDILAAARRKEIASFNTYAKEDERLPYIVVVIDEMADIMVTSGAEAENLIIRLAQMARAVGIHLVLATQRPSVDVITGLIKANITSRIAFSVASQMDSRTILDTPGAEKLIGRGDMLFISAELSKPVRIQGAYISDSEIERVVDFLKANGEPQYQEEVVSRSTNSSDGSNEDLEEDDELITEAKEVLLQAGKASASFLQRRLRIGYARAARILDILESQGYIGPADGARPREVYANGGSKEARGDNVNEIQENIPF